MGKTKLTSDEILEAEKAKDERVKSRNRGYSKMKERDQGWQRLHCTNARAVLLWGVQEDRFALDIEGKKYIFDTEDFRKALRWA